MRAIILPALAAAGATLAGCVTTAAPPPSALLEYARSDCSAAPDLSTAVGLTPEKEKQVHTVTAPIGAKTACMATGTGASPYAVFALPQDIGDKTLVAGAQLEPLRILSPKVSLLDASGQVTRTFEPADYLYRGTVFSVQFKPREGEAYVLVAADPDRVGKRYDSITTGIASTVIYTGYGAANWNSGAEWRSSRTFSWEGLAQVSVYDEDTKEGR